MTRRQAIAVDVLKHEIGYDLVVNRETGRLILGIRCQTCQRISYNAKDIDERYCGACHRFYDDRNWCVA